MFFQQAFEGLNDWWRWLVVILIALLAYGFGQLPFTIVYLYYMSKSGFSMIDMAEMGNTIDLEAAGMNLNLGIFLLLLMFVCMAGTLMFMVKAIHQRAWKTLITPLSRINWDKIFFSFSLWMFFTFIIEIVSYSIHPEAYTLTFNFWDFLPLLVIIILLMPIQTTSEELLFRGYLMQGIGIWSGSKIVPLIISSILFGMMHLMNPEINEFGLGVMMTYYISVGLFLGLITIMDDSLELAIGVHAATNMFSALFISYEGGAIQTYAIFKTEVVNVGLMLPIFLVVAAVFFIICWKKYNWEGWSKLTEPIVRPPIVDVSPPPMPNQID